MKREKKMEILMESFYNLNRCMNAYESLPRTYGTGDILYMAEAHMIEMIGRLGRITTTELAEKTEKTKSAISQIINKLWKKGIVQREKNPESAKEIFISLTDKGRVIEGFHSDFDKEAFKRILTEKLSSISDEEMDICIKVNNIMAKDNFEAAQRSKKLWGQTPSR